LHLNRDERDSAVEQVDDVQEPARDVLGHDHGAVLILRVSLAFDVPILDRPNDVGLVRKSKLNFNFVAAIAFGLLKEQVQPTGARLVPFFIFEDEVAKTQDCRILGYARLHPAFVQIWMVL
jgi:hypothetical protein